MDNQKIRIDFLDGIRGASAVFVVLFHSYLFTQNELIYSDDFILRGIQNFVSIGHISVSVFIVLSGFCLAIPVVKNDLNLKGGFKRYIKRRANRIIFPYYAALFLSVLLYFAFPVLQVINNTAWDGKIPITLINFVAHILLVHNLNYEWIYKINGAHWSVATEWHIYFLYPLMLYFWKKINLVFSIIIFSIITALLYLIIPFAEPQFILLFFLGVISAYFSFGDKRVIPSNFVYWVCVFLFFPISICVFYKFPAKIIYQILFGVNFSLLLNILVGFNSLKRKNKIIDFFETKPLLFLGKISYSLYLIHGPFLALFNLIMLKNFDFKYETQLIFTWFIVVPFCVLLSWIFYYFVERRFQNK